MKRIFTLVLSALMLGGGNAFAQEEDMTSYIVNAGFDTDLTWNADGSKKGPKVNEKELSNRSIAYETEDGSLYATVNSKTDKKRADGRTYEATNGFVGQLNGWEWVNLSDATKPNERHESNHANGSILVLFHIILPQTQFRLQTTVHNTSPCLQQQTNLIVAMVHSTSVQDGVIPLLTSKW